MKCPIDGSELRISERQGIEIDYCPQCRGIWLDRGELDKLLERSAQVAPYTAAPTRERDVDRYDAPRRDEDDRRRDEDDRRRDDDRRYRDDDDDRYDDRKRKKKRARSFLEDILDFD